MKKILLLISLLVACSLAGTLRDPRDGNTYRTVKIGNQEWMAENLNYITNGSICYELDIENCNKYGRLYNWNTAMIACPAGWHLPSKEEWETLWSATGGEKRTGKKMKSKSGWHNAGNGTDAFSFSILPAGEHDDIGRFFRVNYSAYFWSATRAPSLGTPYYWLFDYEYDYVIRNIGHEDDGFSVRCIRSSKKEIEATLPRPSEVGALSIKSAGILKDTRDGQTYKTLKIGNRKWMAENLNFATNSSVCYDNISANCKKYGRLYNWDNAMTACPAGWHLPNNDDWNTLWSAAGGTVSAGTKLKSKSGWGNNGNGIDAFGFSVLPAGIRSRNGDFDFEISNAFFWSASEIDPDNANFWNFFFDLNNVDMFNFDKAFALSVRCIQDSSLNDEPIESLQSSKTDYFEPIKNSTLSEKSDNNNSFTDTRDGQTYRTVKIGNQEWMAQNLNYKTSDSWCYDNKPENCKEYGRLYDWYTAENACPAGWHLPSKSELETLINAVGGKDVAGKKLKSKRGWENGGNGTDAFGFSVLPAGYREGFTEYFHDIGNYVDFWSSTEGSSDDVYEVSFNDNSDSVEVHFNYDGYDHQEGYNFKNDGNSVRCLKDSNDENGSYISSSSSSSVRSISSSSVKRVISTGSFTDPRNGQKYKTVKIGNQNWMAENLNYQTGNSWCYNNNAKYCQEYGRLYDWKTATTACPSGWHLPSKGEFETLVSTVGGSNVAGIKLRAQSGWMKNKNGTDDIGFTALHAPTQTHKGDFNDAIFWSSTEDDYKFAYTLALYKTARSASTNIKKDGIPIRCLQDSNSGGIVSKPSSKEQPSNANQTRINKSSIVYDSEEFEHINQTKEAKSENEDKTGLSIKKIFFNLALGLGYHGLTWGWESEKYNNNDELTGTGVAKDFQIKLGYPASEKWILHGAILAEWSNVTFSERGYELEQDVSELIVAAGATYYFTENLSVGGSIGYGKIKINPYSMEGLVAQANIGYDYWINDNIAIGGSCSLQIARAVKEMTDTERLIGTPKSISFLLTFTYLKSPDFHD